MKQNMFDIMNFINWVYKFDNVVESLANHSIKTVTKNKAGVYIWRNKTNGHDYVVSSGDLWARMTDYRQPGYLEKRNTYPIVRALRKYGLNNFELYILELVAAGDKSSILAAEDRWINIFSCDYNISPTAFSNLGTKLSTLTKLRISIAKRVKVLWQKNKKRLYRLT